MTAFAVWLTATRTSRALTQQQMADAAKVHPSMISKWEHSDTLPAPASVGRVAEALGIDPAGLHRIADRDRTPAVYVPRHNSAVAADPAHVATLTALCEDDLLVYIESVLGEREATRVGRLSDIDFQTAFEQADWSLTL